LVCYVGVTRFCFCAFDVGGTRSCFGRDGVGLGVGIVSRPSRRGRIDTGPQTGSLLLQSHGRVERTRLRNSVEGGHHGHGLVDLAPFPVLLQWRPGHVKRCSCLQTCNFPYSGIRSKVPAWVSSSLGVVWGRLGRPSVSLAFSFVRGGFQALGFEAARSESPDFRQRHWPRPPVLPVSRLLPRRDVSTQSSPNASAQIPPPPLRLQPRCAGTERSSCCCASLGPPSSWARPRSQAPSSAGPLFSPSSGPSSAPPWPSEPPHARELWRGVFLAGSTF